jgi:hypothetical protein
MASNAQQIATREKIILIGLYLSKYDSLGLKKLGFKGFKEAFNVIGYALGAQPASIKNYRDEFDPLFPNRRKGWHKRATRDYCLKIFEKFSPLFPNCGVVLWRIQHGLAADTTSGYGPNQMRIFSPWRSKG